jgi:hypothetical protein
MGRRPTLTMRISYHPRAPTPGHVDDVWYHESEPKLTWELPGPRIVASSTSSKVVSRTLLRTPADLLCPRGRVHVRAGQRRADRAGAGRKTDVKDRAWIAQLLEHGLTRGSFVPPVPIRELRDRTRYRAALIGEDTRETNRLQNVLEDAGIKLASVASERAGFESRQSSNGSARLRGLLQKDQGPARRHPSSFSGVLGSIPRRRIRFFQNFWHVRDLPSIVLTWRGSGGYRPRLRSQSMTSRGSGSAASLLRGDAASQGRAGG